jgi:type II secretory pathway component PulM
MSKPLTAVKEYMAGLQSPVVKRVAAVWAQTMADRRRRYLFAAGAVLILLGLAYRLYPSAGGMDGGDGGIDAARKRVAKYRRVVDGKSALEARLAVLQKSLQQAEAGLLTGQTTALAAADLQNALGEIALACGVEIRSMQVLPSQEGNKESELFVGVPVQISTTLTARQLKDMLYRIETFPRFFLTVQWIRINTVGAGDPGMIRCDMAVAGIMKNVKE